jgi:putative ABC transport system permease protein
MSSLFADLRYSLRLLRQSPGFTLVAVLALALGIGANTAIFSTVDAVMLKPLAFADADRLVMVWEDASHVGFPRNTPSPGNYFDWKEQNTVFTDMAASRGRSTNLTGDGPPEQVYGRGLTANFFRVAGVQPLLGRAFTEEEDRTNAPVVLISHGLWQRRWAGDPALVGNTIQMDGRKVTVIGVMPPYFSFPNRAMDFWGPAAFTPSDRTARGSHFLQVIARLKPGVTVETARNEMQVIARRLAEQYPRFNAKLGAVVVPMRQQLLGETRTALWILLAAAACVLLIACANLANLLLARSAARGREMAVRAALGAGRGRLVRQMLTEALVLSLLGGAAGLALARAGMTVLAKLVPFSLATAVTPSLDARVLLFTVVLSALAGVVFSLVPALQVSARGLADSLKERGGTGQRGMRDALVVAEVALALMLLVGAGLMIKTLARLRGLDLGFDTAGILTARTTLPRSKYPDNPARLSYYTRVLDQVAVLPGVRAAGFASTLPLLEAGNTTTARPEGWRDSEDALYRVVTRDYLTVLAPRVKEGRLFDSRDRADSLPVVVVNETFRKRFWPNESAVGKRIQCGSSSVPWFTIIAVVEDLRERGLEPALKPGTYYLIDQNPDTWAVPGYLAVRTTGDPLSIARAVPEIIGSVDREQPVAALRTMDEVAELQVANRRQQMTLFAAFAGLALVLASVGLYGVLSYAVALRTREIGVRMALGAQPAAVVAMILRRGVALAGIGVVIGLGGAWAATRAMTTLLYGVTPTDPVTYAAVPAILIAVALVACWIPARRAARLDPAMVLRQE